MYQGFPLMRAAAVWSQIYIMVIVILFSVTATVVGPLGTPKL